MSQAQPPWQPGAELEILRRRAQMLAITRDFFAERAIMEVETPALSAAASTAPALASFQVVGPDGQCVGYLHTSPEFPMKRLLAAGSGSIYQISRVFRAGEQGRLHNPEFTLVEWYRVGFDHHALMQEIAELLGRLLPARQILRPADYLSYQAAFGRALDVDPLEAPVTELAAVACQAGLAPPEDLGQDRDGWLDLLLSHLVQPSLGRGGLTFLHSFPASQAALAQLEPGDPRVARRFEVYLEGIELANGFHELHDACEQRRRFQAEQTHRARLGLPAVTLDQRFLAALEEGPLPSCAGVALGFDRAVMLAVGAESLSQVMAFSTERA